MTMREKVRVTNLVRNYPLVGLARSLRMTICRLRLVGAVAEYYDGMIMYGEGRFDFSTHGFGCSL